MHKDLVGFIEKHNMTRFIVDLLLFQMQDCSGEMVAATFPGFQKFSGGGAYKGVNHPFSNHWASLLDHYLSCLLGDFFPL